MITSLPYLPSQTWSYNGSAQQGEPCPRCRAQSHWLCRPGTNRVIPLCLAAVITHNSRVEKLNYCQQTFWFFFKLVLHFRREWLTLSFDLSLLRTSVIRFNGAALICHMWSHNPIQALPWHNVAGVCWMNTWFTHMASSRGSARIWTSDSWATEHAHSPFGRYPLSQVHNNMHIYWSSHQAPLGCCSALVKYCSANVFFLRWEILKKEGRKRTSIFRFTAHLSLLPDWFSPDRRTYSIDPQPSPGALTHRQ